MIAKKDLIDRAYYKGECRNASEGMWLADFQCFVTWRHKFGFKFVECIHHRDDDDVFDVFDAEELVANPNDPIILDENDYKTADCLRVRVLNGGIRK
jgi:hypothetical protein